MATGIGPKLPLALDASDGAYRLIKTYQEEIKQNLKLLVLTAPGERVMIPDFGVGLRNYLFELGSDDQLVFGEIESRIRQQAAKYLPFIEIDDVMVQSQQLDPQIQNTLTVSIFYTILPLDLQDSLAIDDFLRAGTI